jgi:hypothetical protein
MVELVTALQNASQKVKKDRLGEREGYSTNQSCGALPGSASAQSCGSLPWQSGLRAGVGESQDAGERVKALGRGPPVNLAVASQ